MAREGMTWNDKLVASHGTQKCCSVRFLWPEEELAKSP
jgi:hypothetical protein